MATQRRGTAIDPLTSGFFGPQEAGDGIFTQGNGDGTGMLTGLENLPGWQSWYTPPSGSGDNQQGGRVDPQAFKAWMDQNGYSMREESAGGGKVTRWMEDKDGNYVIQPQTMGSDKNWGRDFILGSLALYGAGTALSGAIGGAGGATAGSTGAGAGGGAAAGGGGLEAAIAASADGGALAASGSGVSGASAAGAGTIAGGSGLSAGGSAGLGGTGAGLSTAGTAAGGTATGLGSTGLGAAGTTAGTTGGGAMAGMTASDWINLGGLVYSVANRPDPVDTSGLEREAARAGNIADRQQTLAERQYADQLAIFNEFKPMLMQQIQGSLQDQSLSRQRSNQQWDDYMSTWRPAEQALAERSLNWATPGRMQAAADEASSAVAGQYDAQRSQATEDMIRAGLDPSSIAALTASGRALEAKDRAGAATSARRTVESQGMAYLDNAARFGRNMPSTGLAAAGLAGQQGQQVQSNYSGLVNASAAPATAASPLFSSAVNSGSSAGGLYRNIAGMQADSQQQQRDWDMGTLAGLNQWAGQGGAARTGNSFGGWFTSSKKTKRVGARVRNSLQDVEDAKVMRWRYKEGEGDGNTKPRMGPMAEDLKRVAPEVSDGKRVDGVSLLGLHHAAIGEASSKLKKQAKKIAALERKMSLADAA
jgi:hypothetical protein